MTVLIPEFIGKNFVECALIMHGRSTDLPSPSTEP
jgi:hypothetical protein